MPFTQIPYAIEDFILIEEISDKSLYEINGKIKVRSAWMLMILDPLLKLLSKTWLDFFLKWQDEDINKEGWTI